MNDKPSTPADELETEKEIQEKGLNAPRVSPKDLDAAIASVSYHQVRGAKIMTVCEIQMKNGFTVTGINHGPVSPENFNQELANKLAYESARNQMWPLLGFLLAQRLFEASYRGAISDSAPDCQPAQT